MSNPNLETSITPVESTTPNPPVTPERTAQVEKWAEQIQAAKEQAAIAQAATDKAAEAQVEAALVTPVEPAKDKTTAVAPDVTKGGSPVAKVAEVKQAAENPVVPAAPTEAEKQATELVNLKKEIDAAKSPEDIAILVEADSTLNENNQTALNEYALKVTTKIQDASDTEGLSEMLWGAKYAGIALAAKKWILDLFPESLQSAIAGFWNDTVDTVSLKNIAKQIDGAKEIMGDVNDAFGFDVDMDSKVFQKWIKNLRSYLAKIPGVDKNDPEVLAYAFSGETKNTTLESKMGETIAKITEIKSQSWMNQESFLTAIADPKKAFSDIA